MGGKVPTTLDRAAGELARKQHGVVTRAQLLALGFGRNAIDHRIATGRLYPVHRGVFAVGTPHLSQRGRWLAAVLFGGPKAVLSHHSAATLWAIRAPVRGPVDVSVPAGTDRRSRAVRVHRLGLAPADIRTRDRIPVTSPSRTLIDLAGTVTPRQLERAVDEAIYVGLVSAAQLRGAVASAGPRNGIGTLREAVFDRQPGSTRTRSPLEEAALSLIRSSALPAPGVNVQLCGLEVDFLWREQRLVVETDGYRAHSTIVAFERDRERDVTLSAAGYTVRRFTHRQITQRGDWVLQAIARELAFPAFA